MATNADSTLVAFVWKERETRIGMTINNAAPKSGPWRSGAGSIPIILKLLDKTLDDQPSVFSLSSYSSADSGDPNKVIPYFSKIGANRLGSGGPLRLIGPNSS
jgi:hypothetical protein